ncbi:Stringent starvation protein B [uncultured Candidatus Thioglobus sp.]|nr:Stringent starvation protein B [uncultured Candidatus Thioglobus sp.]
MEDSGLTPHILVDCLKFGVVVPKPFIQQDKIVLNIGISAASALMINNESISFKARFDGKSQDIYVPTNAVLTIYAGENGKGMFFETESKKTTPKKPNLTLLD